MIITLIMISITLFSFGFSEYLKKKKGYDYYYGPHDYDIIFCTIKFISSLITAGLIASITIINCSIYTESIRIEYQEKYTIIMAAINDKNNITLLASEISHYNSEIIKARAFHNNPWTSWLCNGVCDELPLIEINKEDK